MYRIFRCIPVGVLFIACFTLACNRQVVKAPVPESLVIFPPPPDTTRIQFLTHFSSSGDLEGKAGGFQRFLFGEEVPREMIKPYGLTVHMGKVYICDTGLGGLVIMDLIKKSFEYFIPGGKGQLKLPINCCFDDRGYLYVADANRGQIVVFDQERKYLHAFGEGEDFRPTDIAVHQDKIWVCNVRDHAIYVYESDDYEFIGKCPSLGQEEDGYIRQATNITIHDNHLYVSDFGDFTVKKYALDGAYLDRFGGYGNHPGSFTRPKGIALDSTGNLYVVDAAFENVQIFNGSGDLLMHFGGAYDGAGSMWLPASVEISYENLSFFEPYVDESFRLKYLIYVTNQYGPARVNVYGFVE
jgi:hypothetical protein